MKHFNIIAIFFAFALFFGGCEDTNENLVGARGVAVVPLISNLSPAVFDSKDMGNTYVEFQVDVPDASLLENAIVKISFNGQLERVDFSTITTFPQTVRISLAEAVSKLNVALADVVLGDVINVEVWTTSDGKVYQTSAVFNSAVVCPYFPDQISGSYHSVSSDWASEGDVTITVDPEDPFIVYVSGLEAIDGLDEDMGPLKMVINNLDYSVTAVKTVLASSTLGWGPTSDYHNIAYEGKGTLNTCDGTYTMSFDITVDEGTFGTGQGFIFTKN